MKNNFYNFYIDKYDLEQLKFEVSNKKILFLIYDDQCRYYLNNNNFLETDENIEILEKISNFNKLYKLEIINFYPVCLCKKTLVMALRTNNVNNSNLEIVKQENINKKYLRLITYHKLNYATLFVSSNVNKEITMAQKYIKRYKFHEKFIKKYILTENKRKKKEFKELLNQLIPNKKSIIDVSCGDNFDVFKIAKTKEYETIVGNDICLNYLKTQNQNYVIYTNDDVETNKIKGNSYDVSYCKNTLHHMSNITNINNILKFLNKISDEIVIIEILDPKQSKGLPKFLNKFLYTKFLKDAGNSYLNEEQFKNIINNNFQKYKIDYNSFTNVLGTYMIAKISKKGIKNEN